MANNLKKEKSNKKKNQNQNENKEVASNLAKVTANLTLFDGRPIRRFKFLFNSRTA